MAKHHIIYILLFLTRDTHSPWLLSKIQ